MNSPYLGMMLVSMAFGLLGAWVSKRLKSKFKKYSMMPLSSGYTGAQVAEKMLGDYNIHDVTIQSVPGKLTDHYNPANKTVNLSPEVYQGRSIAAAAVAAHECGHAVQHATDYAWLGMRSKLVPVVSIAANYLQYVMMASIFLLHKARSLWNRSVGSVVRRLIYVIILATVFLCFKMVGDFLPNVRITLRGLSFKVLMLSTLPRTTRTGKLTPKKYIR